MTGGLQTAKQLCQPLAHGRRFRERVALQQARVIRAGMTNIALALRLVRHRQRGTGRTAQFGDQIVQTGRAAEPDIDRTRGRLAGLHGCHENAHQILHVDEIARLPPSRIRYSAAWRLPAAEDTDTRYGETVLAWASIEKRKITAQAMFATVEVRYTHWPACRRVRVRGDLGVSLQWPCFAVVAITAALEANTTRFTPTSAWPGTH